MQIVGGTFGHRVSHDLVGLELYPKLKNIDTYIFRRTFFINNVIALFGIIVFGMACQMRDCLYRPRLRQLVSTLGYLETLCNVCL